MARMNCITSANHMKRRIACLSVAIIVLGYSISGCSLSERDQKGDIGTVVDRFGDIRVLRFDVPGFDELDLQEKQLAYYLYQATLSGRDIMWDQNYAHNLRVRRTLEAIVRHYSGDRDAEPFLRFMVYTKRVWFSNGIHHHVSNEKFMPDFRFSDLSNFAHASRGATFPLRDGQPLTELLEELRPIIFDPDVAPKKLNRSEGVDKVTSSAVNFYENVTEAEVNAFYDGRRRLGDPRPVSDGLNSKLVRGADGHLVEQIWKIDGMYGDAIERIVRWLELAITVAENERQSAALELLVQYYRTGDLAVFNRYNIAWIRDTDSTIDLINGFIEVYDDPLGLRGSFESIVSFRNPEATVRIATIGREAQWFEDHSPIRDAHKRESVKGVVGSAITVIVESGDASPTTPSGINLPNSHWIRANYGSKSVNLTNIVDAYAAVRGPALREFAASEAEFVRCEKYDRLGRNLLTDMHEVIGHASGKIADGVGSTAATLRQYASTLEEARADLVGLYFIMDPKLVEIGVAPDLEVGEAVYDSFIRGSLLQQLHRVEPGSDLEEDHMRNRQLIAAWVFEKGSQDGVIDRQKRDGKTSFTIRDYAKLRSLFGELLRETQRIKSEGDYEAARTLVETYGVKIDKSLHAEVRKRYAALDVARFTGFLNPRLVAERSVGRIVDVKIEYPNTFEEQMIEYADAYSFLPNDN